MPQVTVFQGSLHVTGADCDDYVNFFDVEKMVYGRTQGELRDNMVAESVVLYQQVKAFLEKEKPSDYDMNDDYWYFTKGCPPLLEEATEEDNDFYSGGVFSNVLDIVRITVDFRQSEFRYALSYLRNTRRVAKIDTPTLSLENYFVGYDTEVVEEVVATPEMTGVQWDEIFDVAVEDGTIAFYRKGVAAQRYFHEVKRKERVRKAAKDRKAAEKTEKKKFSIFS